MRFSPGTVGNGVAHIDVAAAHSLQRLPPGPWLVVFWSEGFPAGQVWLEPAPGQQADVTNTLAKLQLQSATRSLPAPLPRASVVICTCDRPDSLASVLASLKQQSHKPYEVVVVDNASSDGRTRAVAEAADVRYILEPRRGLDIARNTGARTATADIVAYADDDVVLHERWLERICGAFDEPWVMAVTGLVLPAELATEAQRQFERYWGFGRGYRRIDFDQTFFASDRNYGCNAWDVGAGASMAFRRECFTTVGMFDERLDVGAAGCSGDSEYWHRILSRGFTCRYEPSAVAFHMHRRGADDLRRQIYAYMRGHTAALLVQFERTRNWGNLRRLVVTLPHEYARRSVRYLVGRGGARDATLAQEIAGCIAGVWYYLTTPRARAGVEP